MKYALNLKQSQLLTLTPQLKQSLLYLQLPSIELDNEIQDALDNNPLLERVDVDDTSSELADSSREQPEPVNSLHDSTPQNQPISHDTFEQEIPQSDNTLENWSSDNRSQHNGIGDADTVITQTAVQPTSLFEHALWQVRMTTLSERDQLIAHTILHSLDDQAYLRLPLSQVCDLFEPELDIDSDEVHAVLSLIKTLDPIGIGAQNLNERLLMLLAQLPPDTKEVVQAKKIITLHLELLAKHKLSDLKQALQTDSDTLSNAIKLITSLNPNITSQFSGHTHNHITPDVLTHKIDGHWLVELNSDNHHKLSTNQHYVKLQDDKQHGDYIKQHLHQANSIIKSLQSRYDTLLQVSNSIIQRQQDFFEHGPSHMQPLVLHDIAQQLNLHESTISRATAGKYLQSPRGVHELKFFFSSTITNATGEDISSTAIRHLIKDLIDNESKQKPLSDNKIAQLLKSKGHTVARRTIAKYREGMNIPSSSQRKPLIN